MTRSGWRAGLTAAAPLLILALLIGSCGDDDDNPTSPGDTTAPAAVTLAVGTVTTTSVQLTWAAPGDDGATGTAGQYDIRYSTSAITAENFASATAATGEPSPAAAGTAQSFTVNGLTPGTPYFFALKTADEVPNWSAVSNIAQATTQALPADTTPPAGVTNLTLAVATATTANLTWTAPGDDGNTGTASQYDVRYSTSEITPANFAAATAVTGVMAPSAAGAPQGLVVRELTPNTPYFFALKTADEVPNWSVMSNVVQGSTAPPPDVTPPAPVTDLATGTVTATSIQITWTAPGDDGNGGTAHAYDIRFSTSEINAANFASATALPGAPAPTAAGTAQSVTLNGLTPNTPYYIAVKTADEVPNWSDLSNVAQATTASAADAIPPATTMDLETADVTATSVRLTWTAPGDDGNAGTAGEYDIRYSTSEITEGNFSAATVVNGVPAPAAAGTAQSVTLNGLTPDTPYFFAMKTADEVPNWSGLSNVAQATTAPPPDATPPAAVADLEAIPADSTDVLLTWTAPGDDGDTGTAVFYDIRYSLANITEANWDAATQVAGEPVPGPNGTAESMHVTGLAPGTDYFFALKTADEVPNASALSNVATASTPTGPTSPPMISALDLPDTVCISSDDPYAQMAKLYATGQLAIARLYSSLGAAFFAPLESADWQHAGDCWDYTYDIGECHARYHVCKTGSQYEYTLTYNGPCYGSNYSDWVAYRSLFNIDTHTGTFYFYEPNTTIIAGAWVWSETADGLSGSYTFYEGDPATAPVQATIAWTKTADGNTTNVTFTTPEDTKWESSFTKTPCSGWLKLYQWDNDASQWQTWPQTDIAWNADGTGFYDTYDDTGQLLEHHAW